MSSWKGVTKSVKMPAEKASATPYRRHRHLVAPAGAAVDFFAVAELQVLAQADAHLAEPVLVAGHRDRRIAQARIGLDEGLLDLSGRNRLRLGQLQIFLGDFDRRARLANGLEIGPRA